MIVNNCSIYSFVARLYNIAYSFVVSVMTYYAICIKNSNTH